MAASVRLLIDAGKIPMEWFYLQPRVPVRIFSHSSLHKAVNHEHRIVIAKH